MNVPLELAKLFKECQNPAGYTPMLGTIITLPQIRIAIGEKIILTEQHLKVAEHVDLFRQDEHGRYTRLHHEAVLLPYWKERLGTNLYLLIGVIQRD